MNSDYITEQNKLTSAGAWIWLLEISVPGPYSTMRYTNNNAYGDDTSHFSTTWPTVGGEKYWTVPFSLDDMSASISGEFPEYQLRIEEVGLSSYLRTTVKASGGMVGGSVRIMIVHSDHLTLTSAAIDEVATILSCEVTAQAVTFTLGIPSLLSRRFPRDRYTPSFCRHKFEGALCGYTQPDYSLTSSQVAFTAGGDSDTVWVGDGGLLALFDRLPGFRDCPDNLLSNGGFESGTYVAKTGWHPSGYADDWTIWGAAGDAERRWSTDKAKYNTHSYYHISARSEAGVSQVVSVPAGSKSQFTMSCWVYVVSTAGEGAGGIRVQIEHVNGYYNTYASGVGWQKLTLTFAHFNRSVVVRLGGIGYAYFDGMCTVDGAVAGDFTELNLVGDAGFTVSGSAHNDGFLIANRLHPINDKYMWVRSQRNDWDTPFTAEGTGSAVTLQLGYTGCDHTLKACRLRNNSQNFGGSPGIAGGVYG